MPQKSCSLLLSFSGSIAVRSAAAPKKSGTLSVPLAARQIIPGFVTSRCRSGTLGLIFLMPLAGVAIGAASGAIGGALTDVGLDDKWMKETAAAIQPGTAALFVLVRKLTADKVLEGLKGEGGTLPKTSL
jgi:uncharacterized membrane protein